MDKCKCLSELAEKLTTQISTWGGKKVKSCSLSDEILNFKTGQTEYGIGIDIKFENQKKEGHTFVIMAYCPMCGKKLAERRFE